MPRRSANFSRCSVKIGRDPPVEKALENKMLGPQKELTECQNPTSRTDTSRLPDYGGRANWLTKSEQKAQRGFAALFHFQSQHLIGAGAPEIDRRDG
jgi:hypothetical protein